MSVLVEGLTVFAWVALWRPGELLLYEWYAFKRDVRLFRKLENLKSVLATTPKWRSLLGRWQTLPQL